MYRSKFETGISVSVFFNFVHRYFGMGRYAMGHQMLLNSSTIFRGKKLLKNTFNENVRLLKRLHTIGFAKLFWSPIEKSQAKLATSCVFVSWGARAVRRRALPIDPAVLLRYETCRPRPGKACNIIFRVALGSIPYHGYCCSGLVLHLLYL